MNDDAPVRRAREELALCEIFESVQGEGASAGAECLFVRLAHCNLRCRWCDTKYSWDFEHYRYENEVRLERTANVASEITARKARRLVITGGEPLIQRAELEALVALLAPELVIEIETNGTLSPGPHLLERVNQWNVSPKLANSGDPEARRIHLDVLRELRASGRAFLKLVIADPSDADEAEALVRAAEWPRERVLLMAQAASRAELGQRGPLVRATAQSRGFGYSPRLHVERWDGERGR